MLELINGINICFSFGIWSRTYTHSLHNNNVEQWTSQGVLSNRENNKRYSTFKQLGLTLLSFHERAATA